MRTVVLSTWLLLLLLLLLLADQSHGMPRAVIVVAVIGYVFYQHSFSYVDIPATSNVAVIIIIYSLCSSSLLIINKACASLVSPEERVQKLRASLCLLRSPRPSDRSSGCCSYLRGALQDHCYVTR